MCMQNQVCWWVYVKTTQETRGTIFKSLKSSTYNMNGWYVGVSRFSKSILPILGSRFKSLFFLHHRGLCLFFRLIYAHLQCFPYGSLVLQRISSLSCTPPVVSHKWPQHTWNTDTGVPSGLPSLIARSYTVNALTVIVPIVQRSHCHDNNAEWQCGLYDQTSQI